MPSRLRSSTQPPVDLTWGQVKHISDLLHPTGWWCCSWHLTAYSTLQDCLGAVGTRPARMEKDPQGRLPRQLGLPAEGMVHGTGNSDSAVRPACLFSSSQNPTFCRPSSVALCVVHPSGRAVSVTHNPGSIHNTFLGWRDPVSELCSPHISLKSPLVAHYNKTNALSHLVPPHCQCSASTMQYNVKITRNMQTCRVMTRHAPSGIDKMGRCTERRMVKVAMQHSDAS